MYLFDIIGAIWLVYNFTIGFRALVVVDFCGYRASREHTRKAHHGETRRQLHAYSGHRTASSRQHHGTSLQFLQVEAAQVGHQPTWKEAGKTESTGGVNLPKLPHRDHTGRGFGQSL